MQILSKKTQNIALGQQKLNNLLRKHFEISAFEFEKNPLLQLDKRETKVEY